MVSKPPLTPEELDTREAELTARLARIEELEAQAIRREKAAKEREKAKKQVLLRLSPSLWDDIAAWAEDDFRSINAQIEFLLTEAVRRRKKRGTLRLLRLKPSLCPLLIQYSALARISITPCGTAPAVTFSSSTG